jgi:transaldolase
VYSPAQAIAASAIGAELIAPYLGRLDDAGLDGAALITQMHDLLAETTTSVLAASIRSPEALLTLANRGIQAFTAPPHVLWGLVGHTLSESAADTFEADMTTTSKSAPSAHEPGGQRPPS